MEFRYIITNTYSNSSQKWCFTSSACHRNRNLYRQTVQLFQFNKSEKKICEIILICGSWTTEYAHIDSLTFFFIVTLFSMV